MRGTAGHVIRERALRFMTLGLALSAAACTIVISPGSVPRPDVVYEPDIAGRITDVSHDGVTDTYTVTVAGETFDIGPDALSLDGSPGSSDSFLVYGEDGEVEWYASIGIASTEPWAGCAILITENAWDAGDSIIFGFEVDTGDEAVVGVSLRKASAWDRDIELLEDGRYPTPYTDWCIDIRGQVETVSEGAGG